MSPRAQGLRQVELLGLRLDGPDPEDARGHRRLRRVDLLCGELLVVEQVQTPAGPGEPACGPPKTAKVRRRLPLEDTVVQAIARHLALQPAVNDEPILRTATGSRIRRPRFHEVWAQASSRAGLPAGTHWHQLRYFYASALIRGGADVKVVMERLGHSSSEETMRT